jgi:hypothetical protein
MSGVGLGASDGGTVGCAGWLGWAGSVGWGGVSRGVCGGCCMKIDSFKEDNPVAPH